ncbi:MAG: DDE-type integrase/transposase/recombinase [Chloroflexi bacterium]|nr:DDE-type integrase/transposase/recombinase [Chloroflexota bacterium]
MKKRWTSKEIEEWLVNEAHKCPYAKPTHCTLIKEPSCTVALEKAHFTEPKPIVCPRCGSLDVMKYGVRNGTQNYICRNCSSKFNNKDAPFHMWTSTEQIGASLNMFYDGMSLAKIARHLNENYKNPVNPSTVYRWVIRYTSKAIALFTPLKPTVCDTWVVDETVVKVGGYNVWYWDILCERSRFLIASHLSRTRTMLDVVTVMRRAWQRTDRAPRFIVSDALNVYPDGIERVFGAEAIHIVSRSLSDEINNNIIERFHGTIKERTKVLRGFKTTKTASLILSGFGINYDFFRPHMSLDGKTPAEVAKINSPFKNWTDVVRQLGD